MSVSPVIDPVLPLADAGPRDSTQTFDFHGFAEQRATSSRLPKWLHAALARALERRLG